MKEVPPSEWEHFNQDKVYKVIQLFRSSKFLVQVRQREDQICLAINRTQRCKGREGTDWLDAITWDEIQEIKNQCGFRNKWLIEYYPPESRTVNIANIRHLWVLNEEPSRLMRF